jgi:hypothetical protein
MANVNRPNGLSPSRYLNGAPWNQQTNWYYIPTSDSTNQYNIGDLVQAAEGIQAAADSYYGLNAPLFAPYITKCAASATLIRGVIVGFLSDPNALQTMNVPATKTHGYYAMVVDDPNVLFEMTDDGLTAAKLVSTAVGQNCDYTVANPTSPAVLSATVIDSNSIATTSTLPLKIVGMVAYPTGNVATTTSGSAAYARWLVRINRHDLTVSTAGV